MYGYLLPINHDHFLDASSHLYKRGCPLVCLSVTQKFLNTIFRVFSSFLFMSLYVSSCPFMSLIFLLTLLSFLFLLPLLSLLSLLFHLSLVSFISLVSFVSFVFHSSFMSPMLLISLMSLMSPLVS